MYNFNEKNINELQEEKKQIESLSKFLENSEINKLVFLLGVVTKDKEKERRDEIKALEKSQNHKTHSKLLKITR